MSSSTEQPAVGDVQYTFKHALTHDVAYKSVLVERRKLLHERIGSAMEASFAQSIDDHLSQLAYHYGRSANVRKALEYLGLAGQQAHRRLAHGETIVHLNAALQLLKSLPEDDERRREEASLQITFAEAAAAARGAPADDEVGAAFARARDLLHAIWRHPADFPRAAGAQVLLQFQGPNGRTKSRLRNGSLRWPSVNPAPQG